MSKSREKNNLELLQRHVAKSISFNEETSIEYLEENDVDVQKFINKGLKKIQTTLNKNVNKQNKGLFFKRVVLAAEIVYNLHNERTFGHVKFQKLMYLCEQVSNMEISNRYTKQAAGPFDGRFMHAIDKEFEHLKWFKVEIIDKGNFKTYNYSLGENVESYKSYYNNYYNDILDTLEWLINTFKTPPTRKVELVATIYSCLDEFIKNKENFTSKLLIDKVFGWSEEKQKKFTTENILNAHQWMIENRLVPRQ